MRCLKFHAVAIMIIGTKQSAGGAECRRRQEDQQLGQLMEEVFHDSRSSYGSPRLVDALHKQGHRCGKNRIRRLMEERGLKAKLKRRRKPRTTDSEHALPVAPNLLQAAAATSRINECWVNDITYIPTQQGWLYLAGTQDSYSRRIVGWQASASLESEVVLQAARRAFANRRPGPGVVYHSDRGSQYASRDCRQLLTETANRTGGKAEYEPSWKLLRQRHDRVLLGHTENRMLWRLRACHQTRG